MLLHEIISGGIMIFASFSDSRIAKTEAALVIAPLGLCL